MLGKKLRYLVIYLVLVAAMVFLFQRMPTAYLPQEDQGVMYLQATLPPGSTLEQTKQVLVQVRDHFLNDEKKAVDGILPSPARSFAGAGQNVGLGFREAQGLGFASWVGFESRRHGRRAMMRFSKIRNAQVFAFPPPAVQELDGRAASTLNCRTGAGWGTRP